jgi:hypothetical protein
MSTNEMEDVTFDVRINFKNGDDAIKFANWFADEFNHGFDLGGRLPDGGRILSLYGVESSHIDCINALIGKGEA